MEYSRLPKKPLSVVIELLGTKWKMLVIKQFENYISIEK